MIAIPKPPKTFGRFSLPAYTRRPGLEILLRPEIIFSFLSAPYFNVMRIVLKFPSSTMSYFAMYPSSKRMSAIANLILEAGTSTVSCLAVFALRILVSISAIGSFVIILKCLLYCSIFLPTCFFNAWDLSFICQFTEANTADTIFS